MVEDRALKGRFNGEVHQNALLRRRIKFVVEKGAMARLFKKGTTQHLQRELFMALTPSAIVAHKSHDEYDSWLQGLIKENRWACCSRNGLKEDRWAYFAKLLNIVIYEIVSNRELVSERDWRKVRSWLHVPLDSSVFLTLTQFDPSFPASRHLKGMTQAQYLERQDAIRRLAGKYGVAPIWFEDAWTS
jgi:hypothetical protein